MSEQVVTQPKAELPQFWRTGYNDVLDVTHFQKVFPDLSFRWVRLSPKGYNQQRKRHQGWKPFDDPTKVARLKKECDLESTILTAAGTIQWMDTELWWMPRQVNDLIREHINNRLARRSSSVRAALEAMAADAAGRSRGAVVPFIATGNAGDIVERKQISEEAARGGRK